jgi:beta-lactam-binding protein with PASTA domain
MDYHETDEHEAGRIIEQLPESETEIPAGTTVQVTVATQIETVVVPDVHGIKETKAIAQLEDSGLRAGVRFTATDQLPEGYVIFTEPRAGASATRGTLIDYTVSSGPETDPSAGPIPTPERTAAPTTSPTPALTASPTPFPSSELALVGDFLCLDLATARSQLEEAGLLVGFVYPEDPPPEESWIVHDQLPKPGESIPLGSAVDLMLEDPLEACPAG